MNRVRVAFVGVGTMGQCAHLRHYSTLPDCEVIALAELRHDTARRVAARYGVPKVYPNHEELLAHEKPDAIVASHLFTRHGVLVPELLKARVPLFIEKPLAGCVAVGERIVEAVRASGTFIMVGYNKRSDPATMWAKRELDALKASGELGRPRYVRITMPPGDWIANGFFDLIKGDDPAPALEGDPPPDDMDEALYKEYLRFVNYYIHQVNLLRHLLGEPYRVTHADPTGILFVAHSESGVPGVIEMAPYNTTLDWQESAQVCFERGWLRIDFPAPIALNRPGRATLFKDPGKGATPQTIIPQLPWVSSMRQQAMNFLAAVRGEAPPPAGAQEALEDLRVARDYLRLLRGR